uniref:Putative secreted protein n=1 Tax=Anopheles marajoara TaxID=58244 RepID=A0A2M4C6E7_9DIPT
MYTLTVIMLLHNCLPAPGNACKMPHCIRVQHCEASESEAHHPQIGLFLFFVVFHASSPNTRKPGCIVSHQRGTTHGSRSIALKASSISAHWWLKCMMMMMMYRPKGPNSVQRNVIDPTAHGNFTKGASAWPLMTPDSSSNTSSIDL